MNKNKKSSPLFIKSKNYPLCWYADGIWNTRMRKSQIPFFFLFIQGIPFRPVLEFETRVFDADAHSWSNEQTPRRLAPTVPPCRKNCVTTPHASYMQKNDSATALYNGVPELENDWFTFSSRKYFRSSKAVYWNPWSRWNIKPSGLLRLSKALSNAVFTSKVSIFGEIPYARTFRENRSIITQT